MVFIYWKYEINKLLSLERVIKIYIGCCLWFSKCTPLEDEIYPWLRSTALGIHFVLVFLTST